MSCTLSRSWIRAPRNSNFVMYEGGKGREGEGKREKVGTPELLIGTESGRKSGKSKRMSTSPSGKYNAFQYNSTLVGRCCSLPDSRRRQPKPNERARRTRCGEDHELYFSSLRRRRNFQWGFSNDGRTTAFFTEMHPQRPFKGECNTGLDGFGRRRGDGGGRGDMISLYRFFRHAEVVIDRKWTGGLIGGGGGLLNMRGWISRVTC